MLGGLGMVEVKVDEEKCTGCGTCAENCPVSVFEMQDKGGKKVSVVVNNDACIVCRTCEIQCEPQAITVTE
jgi:NAD-dependent dihydropyrimidine dehydrogenase PreA subunit